MAALRLIALVTVAASVASAYASSPNEKKPGALSFSSIIVPEPKRSTLVTCDDNGSRVVVPMVLASSTATMQAVTAGNETPEGVFNAVRIQKGAPGPVLALAIKKAKAAASPVRARITIRDLEGNREVLSYRIEEEISLELEDTNSSPLDVLPSFSLPKYEELPMWARNQKVLTVTFSLHARHNRSRKPALLSTTCCLTTLDME